MVYTEADAVHGTKVCVAVREEDSCAVMGHCRRPADADLLLLSVSNAGNLEVVALPNIPVGY